MPYKHVRIAGTRRQVGQALGKLARPLMSAYRTRARPGKRCAHGAGIPGRAGGAGGGAASGMGRIRRAGRGPGHAAGRRAPVELSRRPAAQDHRRLHLGGPEVGGWHALDRPQRRWRPLSVWPLPPVDVALDDAPGYLGFYYPGSLPGHTFGANRAGLVQTINNLRARQRHEGVPRMFGARGAGLCHAGRGRAAAARHALRRGFHHTLGSAQDARLFSVEVLPGDVSIGNRRALRPRQPHDPRRHRRPASSRHRFVARAPAPHRRHRRQLVARDRRRRVAGRAARYRGHCRSCARTGMTPMARTRWPPPCLRSATAKSRCACTTKPRAEIALDVMNDPE